MSFFRRFRRFYCGEAYSELRSEGGSRQRKTETHLPLLGFRRFCNSYYGEEVSSMVERRLKCLRPPVRVRHFLFRFCMEKKNKFGKEFTMEKRPLDTELEVLWSEHLEDDVFSVRAYNVLAHRLGLRTLGDILNLTRDDIAKVRGAGEKDPGRHCEAGSVVRIRTERIHGRRSELQKVQTEGFPAAGASALSQIGKGVQPLVSSSQGPRLCVSKPDFRRRAGIL